MDSGLKNKTVLVCGASQGIGRAAAQAFAAEGANVAICARTEKTLQSAAASIRTATGFEVTPYVTDVSSPDSVSELVQSVIKKFGRVDVCVANAAGPPPRTFFNSSNEDWRKAIDMNFLSVVYLAREVLPLMQKNKWGRFITITSTSVRQPVPDLLLSNSVRPAVVGLMKSLTQEFGRDGITFNNVGPGYTTTERLSELAAGRAKAAGVTEQDVFDRMASEVPLRRLGKPEEIADAIVWLASERASYITGQTILVDGGIYKGM
ncbi:MAG TPA: SDR family oxidoreductase [Terriglobales bacterium]|nr:SDR family oxidoreductase [Terriglobales bacterium]